jgi:hypothetical protein
MEAAISRQFFPPHIMDEMLLALFSSAYTAGLCFVLYVAFLWRLPKVQHKPKAWRMCHACRRWMEVA